MLNEKASEFSSGGFFDRVRAGYFQLIDVVDVGLAGGSGGPCPSTGVLSNGLMRVNPLSSSPFLENFVPSVVKGLFTEKLQKNATKRAGVNKQVQTVILLTSSPFSP